MQQQSKSHKRLFPGLLVQEDAMQNRKRLADSTKEFRKAHADDSNTKAVRCSSCERT